MAKAVFYQKGEAIDYRPENDVAAGEVIVQGDLVGITRLDIPAGRLGSIAVCGVFKVAKKANDTFSVGTKVYWNGTAATTTTDDVVLGLAVADSAAADADVLVLLNA